jgi:hypothetical protein
MSSYIYTLLLKFKHPHPTKPRLSPYKCLPITYGSKSHIPPDPNSLEPLDASRKCRVQKIVGSFFWYTRVVDNKLLVALSAISACQAKASITTKQTVDLLLDYVATYPNDGIVY